MSKDDSQASRRRIQIVREVGEICKKQATDEEKRQLVRKQFRGNERTQALAQLEKMIARARECGDSSQVPNERNRRIDGVSLLGSEPVSSGGSSEVWKARDVSGDIVAVKIINSAYGHDEGRIQKEIEVLQSLNHQNIVRFRGHKVSSLGEHCIVMDWVGGKPPEKDRLSPSQVVKIGKQLAEALSHLHEKKLIHRDIKPGNIHLDHDLRPTLLDFGIVKDLAHPQTKTGESLMTERFASPEQKNAVKDIDCRTDIYSLGKTLEYVSNSKSSNSQVRQRLKAVIAKCLNEDRAKRYATAEDLRDALKSCRAARKSESAAPAADSDAALELQPKASPATELNNDCPPVAADRGLHEPAPILHRLHAVRGWLTNHLGVTLIATFVAGVIMGQLPGFWSEPEGGDVSGTVQSEQKPVFEKQWAEPAWNPAQALTHRLLCHSLRMGFVNSRDVVHIADNRETASTYLAEVESRLGDMDEEAFLQTGELFLATARSWLQEYDLDSAKTAAELLRTLVDACRKHEGSSHDLVELRSRALHELAIVYHGRLNPEEAEEQYVKALQSWTALLDETEMNPLDKEKWHADDSEWISGLCQQPIHNKDVHAGIARVFGYLGDYYCDKRSNEYALGTYLISLSIRNALVESFAEVSDVSDFATHVALLNAQHQQMRARHNLLRLAVRLWKREPRVAENCLKKLEVETDGSLLAALKQAHSELKNSRSEFLQRIKEQERATGSGHPDDLGHLEELIDEVRSDHLWHFLDIDVGLIATEAMPNPRGEPEAEPDLARLTGYSSELLDTAGFALPVDDESIGDNLTRKQRLMICHWQLMRIRNLIPDSMDGLQALSADDFKATAVTAVNEIRGDVPSGELPKPVFRIWAEVHYELAKQEKTGFDTITKFIRARPETLRTYESSQLLMRVEASAADN